MFNKIKAAVVGPKPLGEILVGFRSVIDELDAFQLRQMDRSKEIADEMHELEIERNVINRETGTAAFAAKKLRELVGS
jgi:hypothetical protein